jgi:hypothetical protein
VEPSWKTKLAEQTASTCRIYLKRGIPKAARIVANVLTPSGDLLAGIKRRQLLHLWELTIETEGSSRYSIFLMLLRDRGIPEATCIVVNVLASVWYFLCRISCR